jgi:hypothetical protein
MHESGEITGNWTPVGGVSAPWYLKPLVTNYTVLFDTDCFWSSPGPVGAIQAEYENASDTCTDNYMCLNGTACSSTQQPR